MARPNNAGVRWPAALKQLAEWRKDRKLKLPKDAVKGYDDLVPAYEKAIREGCRSFEAAERQAKV